MGLDYIELFGGPGGWTCAAEALDLHGAGVELDADACSTRDAAGFLTWPADVLQTDPSDFAGVRGLIASPPCQSYSVSGSGVGRRNLDAVLEAVDKVAHGHPVDHIDDLNTRLVLEPLKWVLELGPEWIALEQVPPVLPIWHAFSTVLIDHGYQLTTGILNAEQYGVPQTRKRAFLLASQTRKPALPRPTHSKFYSRDPHRFDEGVAKWVSMAEALESYDMDSPGDMAFCPTNVRPNVCIRPTDQPAPTMAFGHEKPRWIPTDMIGFPRLDDGQGSVRLGLKAYRARDLRPADQPAQTVTSKARSWSRFSLDGEVVRVSLDEVACFQTFPASHPFRGSMTSQFLQVSNAVPPRLAEAVLHQVI